MADNETIADIVAWLRTPQDGENGYLAAWREEIADRLGAAHKRETDEVRLKPDQAWREICAKCQDGEIEPDCDYYGEPNGCNSPIYQHHPMMQFGNAAKMREALEFCVKGMCGFCRMDAEARGMTTECVNGCEALRKAKAALAAPPRNCDKYATADEALKAQEQMFNDSNFANGECKLGCPECDNPRVGCKIAWLFAPATEQEGGAK